MIFSSYEFLFLFLPLVLAGYYLLPARARTVFLTLASYFFYGWWDYRFCGLMLLSTLIDYVAGKGIASATTPRGRKRWMLMSVVSNLSLLGFFKYFDMFASTVNVGLAAFFSSTIHHQPFTIPLLHLVLPVGISFYTFQSMSYAIDLYRGQAKPTRSFMDFACYVSLFPQLVAGPILRYSELADQLVHRNHSIAMATKGAGLFILGLAKKVLVADAVAPLTALAFGPAEPGLIAAWVGTLAYAIQIYFDFSGYSDMAVGLGLMFGFRFPLNFNSPYQAISITDFWRRWHISLSTWLRDYLYIPLGGNRKGPVRTYVNLALVMVLGGLWHGANWTFVTWGAIHGLMLAWERYRSSAVPGHRWFGRIRTFLLVCVAWVAFRSGTMTEAVSIWSSMVGLHGWGSLSGWEGGLPLGLSLGLLGLSLVVVFTVPHAWTWLDVDSKDPASHGFGTTYSVIILKTLVAVMLLVLSIGVLMVNSSSPFLYFQF
jgi:alginate O-acetyltransferase complex protein AlgI